MMAFDCESVEMRDVLFRAVRKNGLHQCFCGTQSMRLRPCLYFTPAHADLYFELLRKTLRELDA